MEALSRVADDSIELEAKRKQDSSWHPCRVSLSDSGESLVVDFGSHELEDMLLKKEEVIVRLRFRSMLLRVDDCCHIEEGVRVLVNHKLHSKNLFHDAAVEKVERIRHSKRGCRCTFMIKWLDSDLEGKTITVPSSSIMKLSTKSISDHPIVHIILKPEKDTDLSYSSPSLTILDNDDAGIDFNKVLQKQIEQICNLADAPEKDFPDDNLLRNKVLRQGQTPHKPTVESNAIPALKRITRSKTKLQLDIETGDQSGTVASMKEEFIQNRPYQSPLASRADLASSLLSAKKCLEMDFNACMTADMYMNGKHSSEILTISIPLVSDASQAISPLISTQGNASSKPSSCLPTKVWGKENKDSEKTNCKAEDRTSAPVKVTAEKVASEIAITAELAIARDKKSSVLTDFIASSTAPMRLTRSAMRKGAVLTNERVEVKKICTENKKRRISVNKSKLCHSAVHQENETLTNEEENSSTHIVDSDSSESNIAIPESNVSAPKSTTSKRTKDASTPSKDGHNNKSDQGKKRKAAYPNKQGRRFSPRNLLPRTRSQSHWYYLLTGSNPMPKQTLNSVLQKRTVSHDLRVVKKTKCRCPYRIDASTKRHRED
ncbi:hypothetical protein V6N11_036709 [Hibiscus sabdariffa]|uniref:SAWADEE domain-containing protein n=1 Tax=Hibiscus sabdariffa TaxID=183260 RepID=A0ABR2RB62_9ROSI